MNNKSKLITSAILSALLISAFVMGHITAGNLTAVASPEKSLEISRNTVSVQGEGIITLVPDIAYISIGVKTSDKEMSIAQKNNKEKMQSVINALTEMGVKKEDIKTQNYSVYPEHQWNHNTGESKLKGYKVLNMLRVTIRDIDSSGKILDVMAQRDANMVYGIEFAVSNSNKAYEDALKLAVKNAEEKAIAMVGYFGKKSVKPVSIVEQSFNHYYPVPFARYEKSLASEDFATPIQAGQMEITARVSIDFEF